MKILVVSLLRLGDFIMIAPVLAGLRRKYPRAQVDVLTFKSTSMLAPIVKDVSRWHVLDRDQLQTGLGRADIPLLTSYDVLKEDLDAISGENYDLVINLSHTVFSGWVSGYIECKGRLGLAFNARGQAMFHSPWFKYLDDHALGKAADIFHYTDLFFEACELEGAREFNLKPTPRGVAEVEALSLPRKPLIVLQTLTSDSKKNWSSRSWAQMIATISAQCEAHFVLLAAPSESEKIAELKAQIPQDLGSRVSTAFITLDGALALLNQSELLITGDTSIKHLANASPARVIEISLGSSDYRRTGIFKSDSLILQTSAPCAPCAHSSSCSQRSHLCAEGIQAISVANVAAAFLRKDFSRLQTLSQDSSSGYQILKTHHLRSGSWLAAELTNVDRILLTETLLERCAWKMLFNQELERTPGAFGSVGLLIGEEIGKLFDRQGSQSLLARLDFLESDLEKVQLEARSARSNLKIGPESDLGAKTVSLSALREQQNQQASTRDHAIIKQKLVRSLKSQVREWI